MNIIYRACSTGNADKVRPIQDKYILVKTCFDSFIKAFEGVDYSLTVLLDKPTPEFREIFKGHTLEESFHTTFDEGNTGSFHRQLEIATDSATPYFFFVEDDYLFVPQAGKHIVDFVKNNSGFFTPYDHPDYYRDERHLYERNVVVYSHHWGSVSATTLTFGGHRDTLLSEIDTIKRYGWADYPMWLDITQRHKLYAPLPSLATHMESEHLAPLTVLS